VGPRANHDPTIFLKTPIGVDVTLPVRQDLRTPEVSVRLGPRRVLRAAMPEAAVDEDRDAEPNERDVSNPARLGKDGHLNAVAETSRM
jgi:hypothetical protein